MSTLYTEDAALVQSDTAEISLEEALLSDLEAYTQDRVLILVVQKRLTPRTSG